eukprot:793240-Pyramimonas_sp.AAC.1
MATMEVCAVKFAKSTLAFALRRSTAFRSFLLSPPRTRAKERGAHLGRSVAGVLQLHEGVRVLVPVGNARRRQQLPFQIQRALRQLPAVLGSSEQASAHQQPSIRTNKGHITADRRHTHAPTHPHTVPTDLSSLFSEIADHRATHKRHSWERDSDRQRRRRDKDR